MRLWVKSAVGLVLTAGLALAVAAPAQAAFWSQAPDKVAASTATLAPPTAAHDTSVRCSKFHQPSVGWNSSASSFVDGYQIQVRRDGALWRTVSVPASATSWSGDVASGAKKQSWSITVISTVKNWRAPADAVMFSC